MTLDIRGSVESQGQLRKINEQSEINPDNRFLRLDNKNFFLEFKFIGTGTLLNFEQGMISYYLKPFGKYEYNPQVTYGTENKYSYFRFDEGYIDFECGKQLYFLAGKKRVNWGVGFFSNPVDVINPLKNSKDPARSEEGTPLISLSLNLGKMSINGLYVCSLDERMHPEYAGYGGSLNFLLGGIESNLYGFLGKSRFKGMTGFTFRINICDLIMYSEAAYYLKYNRLYYDSRGNAFDKKDGAYSGLFGVNYTFNANVSLSIEYFYDKNGYTEFERINYYNTFMSYQADYSELYTQLQQKQSRNYLGVHLSCLKIRDVWDIGLRSIVSFDKISLWVNAYSTYQLNDYLGIQLEFQDAFGRKRSEYANSLYEKQINCSLLFYY